MSLDYFNLKTLNKAALHCAKHSSSDVIGALSSNDCFPMFHSRVTAAITEVTLALLKESNIIGFYESRLRSANTNLEPSRLIQNLAQALKTRSNIPVFILCIDSDWSNPSPLHLFALTSNSFTKIYEYPVNVVNEVRDFVQGNTDVFDFDDHFANIEIDWRNPQIS